MELFNEEIINTICDLNDENENVPEVLQTYEKILDEIIDEMKKNHQESSLYFGNVDELKSYMEYLLKRKQYEVELNLKEKKLRIITCDCGCVWKLYVEPDSPEFVDNYWLDRHHADRSPESFPMSSVMERAIHFKCSICERIMLIRSARSIYKIESEKIPPHALRHY